MSPEPSVIKINKARITRTKDRKLAGPNIHPPRRISLGHYALSENVI
jgi:hypothetical protein